MDHGPGLGRAENGLPPLAPFCPLPGVTITISYSVFILYPTYVVRPQITGQDFFSQLVVGIYGNDQAHNALPSGQLDTTLIISIFWLR